VYFSNYASTYNKLANCIDEIFSETIKFNSNEVEIASFHWKICYILKFIHTSIMEKQYLSEKEFTNLQTLLRVNFVCFYFTKNYLQCITYYNNIID